MFRTISKKNLTNTNLSKKSSLQNLPPDNYVAILTAMSKNFCTHSKTFRPMSGKSLKFLYYFKIYSLKKFFLTRRKQFWKPSPENFSRSPKNFSSEFRKTLKILISSKKHVCSKLLSDSLECSFDNPVEFFSTKV